MTNNSNFTDIHPALEAQKVQSVLLLFITVKSFKPILSTTFSGTDNFKNILQRKL